MVPFFAVYSDFALLIGRVVLGVILVAHGWPKVKNFKGTVGWMESIGLKPGTLFAGTAALIETLGGLMLIFGLFTQCAAAFVVLEFIFIIARVTFKKGLVGGYELDLALLGLAVVLWAMGGGEKSLDALLRLNIFW